MTTKQLLKYLDDIVGEWWFLGIQLGIKETTLRTIKSDNNNDVQNCKIGMLQVWQSDSSLHPSWHQLVQALTEMNEYRTVEKIKKDISKLVTCTTYVHTKCMLGLLIKQA